MKIECPKCAFWREVPEDRLPPHAAIATCPQCACRFRFFHEESKEMGENPLPPGAHIPDSQEPLYTQTQTEVESDLSSRRRKDSQKEEHDHHAEPTLAQDYDAHTQGSDRAKRIADDAHTPDESHDLSAEEHEAFALKNPWDNITKNGYFASFYQTLTSVMFAPQRFFAGIEPQKSHVHVLIFFVIISLLQIMVERFWGDMMASFMASTAISDPELQTLIGMLKPRHNVFFALLLGAALASFKIIFTSVFYFAFFKLTAPRAVNFSLIFQIVAYSSAPLLLCFVPALGSLVGFVWSVVCTLIGCRYAMRLSWGQVLLGIVPYYLVAVPFAFILVNSF